ncbi:MAG: APC family permease [Acetilactobacillus jinshanensis]
MEENKNNRGKLTVLGLFALAISGIAPTGSMAYSTTATAKVAGYNVPLSFLLGGLGILCVALCFAAMAKHIAGSGSAYAYNRQAFGEKGGFITGWIMVFAYFVLMISQPGLAANYINVFLHHFGISLSMNWMTFIIIGVVWLISLFGIKVTSKIAFVTEGISLIILIILSAIILIKAGITGTINPKPFVPHHNYGGIGQGMIFAILSYSGFEEISTVSFRTKNPKRTIPRTMIWTVILIMAFYLVVTFVEVNGFGIKNIGAFANSPSPLDTLSTTYLGNGMAMIMDIAILLSGIASVLGCTNACAYMMYALGAHHYLPSPLGKFDADLNSPKNAVNVTFILCAIAYAIFGIPYGYQAMYSNASTLGVMGILIVYMMVCAGSGVYFARRKDVRFSWFRHLIIPVVGILVLIMPFVSNIYPVPQFPGNLYPYIIIGWIVIGFIVAYVKKFTF